MLEESIRVESPVQWLHRITTRDTEFDGVSCRTKLAVILSLGVREPRRAQVRGADRFWVQVLPSRSTRWASATASTCASAGRSPVSRATSPSTASSTGSRTCGWRRLGRSPPHPPPEPARPRAGLHRVRPRVAWPCTSATWRSGSRILRPRPSTPAPCWGSARPRATTGPSSSRPTRSTTSPGLDHLGARGRRRGRAGAGSRRRGRRRRDHPQDAARGGPPTRSGRAGRPISSSRSTSACSASPCPCCSASGVRCGSSAISTLSPRRTRSWSSSSRAAGLPRLGPARRARRGSDTRPHWIWLMMCGATERCSRARPGPGVVSLAR